MILSLLVLTAVAEPSVDARTARAFGDHLLQTGDAYNALTWYRLALFLEPDAPDADALRFRMALAWERGERYPAAVFAYGQVTGPLMDQATYRAAVADFEAGNLLSADHTLETLTLYSPDSVWAPRAAYTRGVLALQAHDLPTASARFATFAYVDSPLAVRASALAAAAAEPVRKKSPGLAAALSVVPGLGQLYTGHPGDAAMAAALNIPIGLGAGLLLADGLQTGRPVEIAAGGLFTGMFALTFPSNLLGAYRGAARANERAAAKRADALLQQAWDPSLQLKAEDVALP